MNNEHDLNYLKCQQFINIREDHERESFSKVFFSLAFLIIAQSAITLLLGEGWQNRLGPMVQVYIKIW